MVSSPIGVLGMHRSGTSCLTGLLEDAGVALGQVSRHNPYNLKGNQENPEIMALHEDLLLAAGGSWNEPPGGPLIWSAAQRRRLEEILDSYRDLKRWGFKDPRTLFALEGWLEARPDLCFIGTFRHPLAVARSLYQRNKLITLPRALVIWEHYNRALLSWQQRLDFPLVDFDLPRLAYLDHVGRAFARLGLKLEPDTAHFFDGALRTESEHRGTDLPPTVRALYRELQVRAI